jgi:hypothetical protein
MCCSYRRLRCCWGPLYAMAVSDGAQRANSFCQFDNVLFVDIYIYMNIDIKGGRCQCRYRYKYRYSCSYRWRCSDDTHDRSEKYISRGWKKVLFRSFKWLSMHVGTYLCSHACSCDGNNEYIARLHTSRARWQGKGPDCAWFRSDKKTAKWSGRRNRKHSTTAKW